MSRLVISINWIYTIVDDYKTRIRKFNIVGFAFRGRVVTVHVVCEVLNTLGYELYGVNLLRIKRYSIRKDLKELEWQLIVKRGVETQSSTYHTGGSPYSQGTESVSYSRAYVEHGYSVKADIYRRHFCINDAGYTPDLSADALGKALIGRRTKVLMYIPR